MDAALPPSAHDLIQDLELETLFDAMARGDEFLFAVAKQAILCGLLEPADISYRQHILRDCLEHPDIVRGVYQLAVETIRREGSIWRSDYSATTMLSTSVEVMRMLVQMLKRLRGFADQHHDAFRSEGLRRFCDMLKTELDDAYFATVQEHLRRLKFEGGELISAELGKGNKGRSYVLREPWPDKRPWLERILTRSPGYSFELPPRDDAGSQALGQLANRGANLVANALTQSVDHVLTVFHALLAELGFYIGCLNLHERLIELGVPTCMPDPLDLERSALAASSLYDVCLALRMKHQVVPNDVDADERELVVITGANQGGKSTFLRSVGLAEVLMQAGMFVPAEHFSANVCRPVFTHYKREEDASMQSGKFDEELARMSVIVDQIKPRALMLFNESFASTNEREGSEVARQIVRALLDAQVKVVYVTHMYDLADSFRRQAVARPRFLRAEREPDGRRTFRLAKGDPLSTSYGPDLYKEIFEGAVVAATRDQRVDDGPRGGDRLATG